MASAAKLRACLASGERNPEARLLLTVEGGGAETTTLQCRIDLRPGGFLLLGEHGEDIDAATLAEMTRINNELTTISRESTLKELALSRALMELEESHAALEHANRQIAEIARRDSLTGAYNRRHFDSALATEIERARRNKSALSVMMIDLDHFKAVNDTYGHATGDAVLVAITGALETFCRPYDLTARYGGENFVVLLPGASTQGAIGCAERLRAGIAALEIEGCRKTSPPASAWPRWPKEIPRNP